MGDQILISKINETYIRIDAPKHIIQELADRFTFEVPNARFLPQVRARIWDGKIRLFQTRTQSLYTGLHTMVQAYADSEDCECIYTDPIDKETAFSVVEARRMFQSLKISTMFEDARKEIKLHDHQERAIIHAIQARRSLLLSPTASGKSVVIYVLARYYFGVTTEKILILVPNVSLVDQLFSDFIDYATFDKLWNAEDHCHLISAGKSKITNKRIVISTWQSLMRQDSTYFDQFSTVLNDEVHLSTSQQISGILARCTRAAYRHGLTGTLKECRTNELVLQGLLGPTYKTISTKELMDDGKVAKLNIKCLQLSYCQEDRKSVKRLTYQEEIDFLVKHKHRNHFIRNLALSLTGNVLLLFQYVERHGRVLEMMIREKNEDPNRKIFFISGDTDPIERERIRNLLDREKNCILIASYGVYSAGVSIKSLENVIFSAPTKSKIRVLQSIGRGLRVSARKTTATLYDIADDIRSMSKSGKVTWNNYSLQHFLERVNYYNTEEFDYKIYKISLG